MAGRNNLVPVDVELPAGPFDVPIDRGGLTIPRLWVVPIDGEPYAVQALNPDMVNWEETAARHKWAANSPGTSPFKWLTFLAWSASRRTGLTEQTWEQFLQGTAQVSDVSGAPDVARPTPPGPVPG